MKPCCCIGVSGVFSTLGLSVTTYLIALFLTFTQSLVHRCQQKPIQMTHIRNLKWTSLIRGDMKISYTSFTSLFKGKLIMILFSWDLDYQCLSSMKVVYYFHLSSLMKFINHFHLHLIQNIARISPKPIHPWFGIWPLSLQKPHWPPLFPSPHLREQFPLLGIHFL